MNEKIITTESYHVETEKRKNTSVVTILVTMVTMVVTMVYFVLHVAIRTIEIYNMNREICCKIYYVNYISN